MSSGERESFMQEMARAARAAVSAPGPGPETGSAPGLGQAAGPAPRLGEALWPGLSGEALERLYTYYEMLVERNNYVNLTAIRDENEIVWKHFADSLSLIGALGTEALEGARLIDIGSGAGFPGMALKIALPSLRVTLLEATAKKVAFLRDVAAALGLDGIEIVQARAEELGHDERFRERCDIAAARAVASLDTLSEYALPFVRIGGRMVAYKGWDTEAELEAAAGAIETMGGGGVRVYEYYLPGVDIRRKLISIGKLSPTPARYPRRAGVPSRRPIGNG